MLHQRATVIIAKMHKQLLFISDSSKTRGQSSVQANLGVAGTLQPQLLLYTTPIKICTVGISEMSSY